jgi:hypothetical protein
MALDWRTAWASAMEFLSVLSSRLASRKELPWELQSLLESVLGVAVAALPRNQCRGAR